MSVGFNLLVVIAAVACPFVMMPILWRRMRRVQRQVTRDKEVEAPRSAWEETAERRDGLRLTRAAAPNEDLIALGDRARHGRWPIDNA